MRNHVLSCACVLLLLNACGSAPRQGRTERTLITAQEIAETHVNNVYEVVERLRPEFLRGRGAISLRDRRGGLPVVYLDGVSYGDLQQLRNIPAFSVQTIEFVSATDAATRWGTGHAGGVIDVRTKK